MNLHAYYVPMLLFVECKISYVLCLLFTKKVPPNVIPMTSGEVNCLVFKLVFFDEFTFRQLSAITKQDIAKMMTIICLLISTHFKSHKSICHFGTWGHLDIQFIR